MDPGIAYLRIGGVVKSPATKPYCTICGGGGLYCSTHALRVHRTARAFSRVGGLLVINLLGTDLEEIFKGRAGELRGDSLVWRDQAILWGLHVARVMSTVQIAVELFPGQQACKARTRLNRLRRMGLGRAPPWRALHGQ